jgi:hypothetical protein
MMLLHGEQYLELKKPMPTSGSAIIKTKLVEVLDKGKAAAVTTSTETYDKESGDLIAVNMGTVFIRGSGGFGGKKTAGGAYCADCMCALISTDRGDATAVNKPPSRKPDAVSEYKTDERQAAVYRLSGDYNPLHIDPAFAKYASQFELIPALNGLPQGWRIRLADSSRFVRLMLRPSFVTSGRPVLLWHCRQSYLRYLRPVLDDQGPIRRLHLSRRDGGHRNVERAEQGHLRYVLHCGGGKS